MSYARHIQRALSEELKQDVPYQWILQMIDRVMIQAILKASESERRVKEELLDMIRDLWKARS